MNESSPIRNEDTAHAQPFSRAHDGDDPTSRIIRMFRPHARLVTMLCCTTLAASILLAIIRGPTYTATALILPTFRGTEEVVRNGPLPTVDAATLLEGRVQLLKSQSITFSIAEQLSQKPEAAPGLRVGTLFANLVRWVFGLKTTSPVDLTASELGSGLSYTYQRRTYLIGANFTASSPERAVAFANAVASQFVHDERLKHLADRHSTAVRTLNEQSSIYGPKHPAVLRAQLELDDSMHEYDTQKSMAQLLNDRELAASGLVVPAQLSTAQQNSRMPLIFSGLLLGLLLSVAYVLYQERARLREDFLDRINLR